MIEMKNTFGSDNSENKRCENF